MFITRTRWNETSFFFFLFSTSEHVTIFENARSQNFICDECCSSNERVSPKSDTNSNTNRMRSEEPNRHQVFFSNMFVLLIL